LEEDDMKICITGFTGAGKSTLAKRLAKRFNLKIISGGEMLKKIALERGFKDEVGWWEKPSGQKFLEMRLKNLDVDMEIDRRLLEIAEREDNIILDAWTMAYLYKGDAIKIYLKASLEERAKRVSKRDRIGFNDALERVKRKDELTSAIYRKLYGFRLGDDLKPFHIVIDTSRLKPDDVELIVSKFITSWLKDC